MRRSADNVIGPIQRPSPTRIPLCILLPVVLLVPSLTYYLGLSSSMTLGACIAAFIVICAFPAERLTHPDAVQAERLSMGMVVLLLLVVIALHLTIAIFIRPVDLARATLSFIPLTLVLFSGYGLGHILSTSCSVDIKRAVYLCFWLMCVLGLLAFSGYVPPISGNYFKPVFPYTEPSHFALSFLPLLMFGCVRLRGSARIAMLAGGLAMGWALESLTLMVGWLLIASICMRLTATTLLLSLLALLATTLDLSYYMDRLDFGGDTQNLSTLVYLQGWQLITESLTLSTGWGLGFQQMGVQGSDVVAANLIFAMLGDNANLLDGSFTFAKLTSEFGALSLLPVLLYFPLAWHALQGLRRESHESAKEAPAITLAQCVVVCFVVELFVRGSGYFSGSTLLFAAAVTIMSIKRRAPRAAGVAARQRQRRRWRLPTMGTTDLALTSSNKST